MRRIFLALFVLWVAPALAQQAPVIAAASDLQFALDEVALRYKAETGGAVRIAYGSSGNLARQIEQGAPFEAFLSADEAYVFRLADRGLTMDRGVLYAVGRIVLIAPRDSPLAVEAGLEGLRAALAGGRVGRFAIANPEHAPYGRAAREALDRAGLWEGLRPFLVLGENVSQAAQFATSGTAQGGIIAYSLALAPEVSKLGRFALIPADAHQPLNQRMVLTKKAGPAARAFHAYLQARPAREVLARYGFTLPGEGA